MAERQYIACAFWEKATRTYTYHNEGEPVAVGDEVRVEVPEGGWKRVIARSIVGKPDFPTKPILGAHQEDAR